MSRDGRICPRQRYQRFGRVVVARPMMKGLASSPGMAGVGTGLYLSSADGASVAAVGLSC